MLTDYERKEDANRVKETGNYDIKGKVYIDTPKKYYFSNLGLRNARINFRQCEQIHSMETGMDFCRMHAVNVSKTVR